MAYVDDNDKLLDPNQQNGGQAQGQSGAGQSTATSDGGGDIVSGGQMNGGTGAQSASTGSQVGSGGTGNGWTNIQNYLTANQGDTGSAKNLSDKVGTTFDAEKQSMQDSEAQTKSQAQGQADSIKSAQSGAAKMIDDASSKYDWSGNKSQDYSSNVNSLKNSLTGSYTGPTDWSYGIGDKAQGYAQSLGSDPGFNQLMGDLYQERAGGQLSSGGRTLQNQLDVNNTALNDTRNQLLQKYSGLGDYQTQLTGDAQGAINQARSDYADNQANLANYIGSQASQTNADVASQENAARSAYDGEYNSQSGRSYSPLPFDSQAQYYGSGSGADRQGLIPSWEVPNMTWHNAQDEQNRINSMGGKWGSDSPMYQAATSYAHETGNALNNFYNTEDSKYADTADAAKRRYNTIEEILGGTPDKTQGFKVRG